MRPPKADTDQIALDFPVEVTVIRSGRAGNFSKEYRDGVLTSAKRLPGREPVETSDGLGVRTGPDH